MDRADLVEWGFAVMPLPRVDLPAPIGFGQFADSTSLDQLFIYNESMADDSASPPDPLTYNVADPIGSIDWSWMSICFGDRNHYAKGAALITPSCVLMGVHGGAPVGDHITFLRSDNVEITREVTEILDTGSDGYTRIGLLDSPINDIDPIPLIFDSSEAAGRFALGVELDGHLNRAQVAGLSNSSQLITIVTPGADKFESGDSGHPVVILFEDFRVALLCPGLFTAGPSLANGPNVGFALNDICDFTSFYASELPALAMESGGPVIIDITTPGETEQTIPSNVSGNTLIESWGAGGGGAGGYTYNGGGGSGAYAKGEFTIAGNTVLVCRVGVGGSGGGGGEGGVNGADCRVKDQAMDGARALVLPPSGSGGGDSAGGAGGTSATVSGSLLVAASDEKRNGASGSNGDTPGSGGAGAASACPGFAGIIGSDDAGTSTPAEHSDQGGGGAGGTALAAAEEGETPGGGGGGGNVGGVGVGLNGAAGGNGRIRITYLTAEGGGPASGALTGYRLALGIGLGI